MWRDWVWFVLMFLAYVGLSVAIGLILARV